MIGIYKITNKNTGKVYIGQSIDVAKRWKAHIYDLNNNLHDNCYLQRAWNKYGEKNFIFAVLEQCTKQELNDKETYWLNVYKPNVYNLGATGNVGTMSDEQKQKIKKWSDENHSIMVKINGEIHNVKDWCKILNLNYSKVGGRIRYGYTPTEALMIGNKYHSLKENDILKIKQMKKDGLKINEIAEIIGVSRTTVIKYTKEFAKTKTLKYPSINISDIARKCKCGRTRVYSWLSGKTEIPDYVKNIIRKENGDWRVI